MLKVALFEQIHPEDKPIDTQINEALQTGGEAVKVVDIKFVANNSGYAALVIYEKEKPEG